MALVVGENGALVAAAPAPGLPVEGHIAGRDAAAASRTPVPGQVIGTGAGFGVLGYPR